MQWLPIVPRHPGGRLRCQLPDVPLQLDQVIKRIGGAQLAGVDQAHQHVAHLRTVQVLSEAEVLGRIKTMQAAGESGYTIANRLNPEGIASRRGTKWHPYAVDRILRRAS